MRKIPAVLVCDNRTSNLEVAGLTLLDRLVVTAHRAGCSPIFLVCETAPTLARAQAMGIATTAVHEIPKSEGAALLITGGVVVEPRDLIRVMEAGGQLIAGRRLAVACDDELFWRAGGDSSGSGVHRHRRSLSA